MLRLRPRALKTEFLVGRTIDDFNCDPDEADGGNKWMVECREHHTYILCTTRKSAMSAARYPEWCEECSKKLQ